MVIDEVTGARNRMSWGESKNGLFTVKSAYAFLTRNTVPRPNIEALYQQMWSVMNPERVHVFLWLVIHQVIMTNVRTVCVRCAKVEKRSSFTCFGTGTVRQLRSYGQDLFPRVDINAFLLFPSYNGYLRTL